MMNRKNALVIEAQFQIPIPIQIQIVLCMRIDDVCMYLYFSQRSLVEWTRALLNNFQL